MKQIFILLENNAYEIKESQQLIIGREGHHCDIEIEDPLASRKHGVFKFDGDNLFVKDTNSLNGIYLNGNRIESNIWVRLTIHDKLKITSTPVSFSLTNSEIQEVINVEIDKTQFSIPEYQEIEFKQLIKHKGKLTIGRKDDNDIVLDDLTVSRYHAEIIYKNKEFWVNDLNSTNGTYLNGKKLVRASKISDSDKFIISLFSFNIIEGCIDLKTEKSAVQAKSISKTYKNNKVGLQPLSLDIPYASFVALMGPSGCGKSTLLKCLNNDNPPSSGEVFIHGLSLKENFNLLKKKIGYVPQDDIIHSNLTVYETLYFAAKIRLADDTTEEEIQYRIDKVINSLSLNQDKEKDIKTVYVKELSGGQRKRISIAVELLIEPTILFLDEPTSPLDPESIDSFLSSLKKLVKEGTTIIMVTHKPEDLNYVEDVIFLMMKGYLAYYGKPEQLVKSFQVDDIIGVYTKLSKQENLSSNIQQYYKHLGDHKLLDANHDYKLSKDKPDSFILQFFWLSIRYFKLKVSDKNNLFLLIAQPIIIAGLICLIFDEFQIGVLFLMAISAIWFGVSNAAKEIVGERPIYRRERMFNLNIHTYVLSKWIILALIALLQTLIFLLILYVKFRVYTQEDYPNIYLHDYFKCAVFMFYISISATLIGLWLSAKFMTTEQVMTVVPIALMPQIMLAGVITKIDNVMVEILSFFTLGRWGTEGFARIQDNASAPDTINKHIESVIHYYPQMDTIVNVIGECNCQSMAMNTENMSPKGVSANDLLGFYDQLLIEDNQLIGSMFDSMISNLSVIGGLDILFYIMLYYALKKHD